MLDSLCDGMNLDRVCFVPPLHRELAQMETVSDSVMGGGENGEDSRESRLFAQRR